VIPDIRSTFAASLWLLSPENWRPLPAVFIDALLDRTVRTVGFLVLFALLLYFRGHIKRRLGTLAEKTNTAERDSFWASAEALIHTLILTAPFPMMIYFLGRQMVVANSSPFLVDSGEALIWIAELVALFELARQWLRPNGFGEAHLEWRAEVIGPIHAGLVWPQILFLPGLYVALHLGWAGLFLDAPADLQSYNNSLGRIAFIVSMLGIGLSLIGVLRPRNWRQRVNRRISFYALPLVTVCFILPPVLAVFGYYLTGILLAYQMVQTAWVGAAVLLLGGLLHRWLSVHQSGQFRRHLMASDGGPIDAASQSPLSKQDQEDLLVAEARSKQLIHFILLLILASGLFSVWAEAIPTLQILKRVQIWPTISMMKPIEDSSLRLASASGTTKAEQPGQGAEDSTEGGPPSAPLPISAEGAAATERVSKADSALTIWHLLQALLSAIITGVLVKNIPGVLELLLLKRTMLDSGARIAFSTLSRYAIMILGIIITFGFLNIGWSNIQWLAAALTFGLGFGLQEIVANFVSGLILLIERPVRVGDAVKIGQLQGRVTRTQIRATTITLWDRSEMVVPNKEFITQKLINWTLSDSRRRVEIPLRVAYGTEVEKVKQVLLGVATAHPDVLEEPAPQALLLEFAEDALKFELRAFVEFGVGLKTKDDLLVAIDKAFREEGIEFALPQLNIKVKNQ
jgi:potassium efflux system protein